jgi:hypothetical protein
LVYYPGLDTSINNLNQASLGNFIKILTWHGKKNQFQTGVEFGLGKYIDASVDYYSKTQQILFSIEELVLH